MASRSDTDASLHTSADPRWKSDQPTSIDTEAFEGCDGPQSAERACVKRPTSDPRSDSGRPLDWIEQTLLEVRDLAERVERLAAERDHAVYAADTLDARIRTVEAERDQLKRHVEALQKSIDYLQPIVDLVKNGDRANSSSLIRVVEQAKKDRAERDRYKVALSDIAKLDMGAVGDIAQEALNGSEETDG